MKIKQPPANGRASKSTRSTDRSPNPNGLPSLLAAMMWIIFAITIVLLSLSFSTDFTWEIKNLFLFDGLTAVMWVAVTFFSGIVHSYAVRYMAGYSRLNSFMVSCFGFTGAVMILTVADHLALFALSWCIMSGIMAKLIGHVPQWDAAKASGKTALRYFTGSSLFLVSALTLVGYQTGEVTISGAVTKTGLMGEATGIVFAALLMLTAMIQSALYPFHKWLMSSMTAPTPASALMHAGFVNAAAILLTRFSSFLYETDFLWVIALIGGAGALLGEFWKFVQANVKRKLACSTVAQMGFMLLQCGLGFFTAAVTHLILHGFYKAHLFLSSGSTIEHKAPARRKETATKIWQLPLVLCSGLAGGMFFAFLTGKGLAWNSGLLLTFVVVLTIMFGMQDILKERNLSGPVRAIAFPLVLFTAIGIYALFYNGISLLMQDLPLVQTPTELTAVHWGIALAYLVAYLSVEIEWYKHSKRLYVFLLNASQPNPGTVINPKNTG